MVAGHEIELWFIANICLCIVTLWDLCRLLSTKIKIQRETSSAKCSSDAELSIWAIKRKSKCQVSTHRLLIL